MLRMTGHTCFLCFTFYLSCWLFIVKSNVVYSKPETFFSFTEHVFLAKFLKTSNLLKIEFDLNSLNAKVAVIYKPVNLFTLQINQMVSTGWQSWRLMS